MLISDLEDLDDILNDFVFEDEPSNFTDEYALDFIETALQLVDEYVLDNPTVITEPDFDEIVLDDIKELFYSLFEEEILLNDEVEDDIDELLEESLALFVGSFYPERSIHNESNIHNTNNSEYNKNKENNENNENVISENIIAEFEEKINKLRNIPQPTQRTPEWYQFRHNLITASNAYKAFESQSAINQLIYEKCQPLKTSFGECEEIKMVNVNTTLHWGQKYEPLSVMFYENNYNTKVEDFGCIQHPSYKFIGASPDGINVDKNSPLYGRMLEIKNIVNREINGIPKKEYWVQMQLQMEVCDLNECDFLETKFVEYEDSNSFYEDSFKSENDDTCITENHKDKETDKFTESEIEFNFVNHTISKDGKTKGVIIYFHTKEGKPFYAYKPLHIKSPKEIIDWEIEMITLYQSDKYNYIFMKYIYWKLEKLSCVLVLRNKEWFKNNIPQLEKVWKTIEEERITGYEHRAPAKKPKKEPFKPFVNTESKGCLLKVIKINTTLASDEIIDN